MKKGIFILCMIIVVITSCKDDTERLFDKTSDERAAEAIAALKAELVAPVNGWKVKYRPEAESGSYYVIMKFNADNTVNIKTDLGANEGEFYDQTITYRIDNSLGLELILESYSFFSFLFEQDQATFGAEYEFDYVNKTPDNALVFKSKTDVSFPPSTILFQPAAANDDDVLLGLTLSENLNTLASDIERFSSSLKLTYENKDLVFYLGLNEMKRTIRVNAAAKKTDPQNFQNIDFETGYLIKGDSMVFDQPLAGVFVGNSISIKGILFDDVLATGSINVCASPIETHIISGTAAFFDEVTLEPTMEDVSGQSFAHPDGVFFAPLVYIFNDGNSAAETITDEIAGALEMNLYYNLELNDGTKLYGIGFYVENTDGSNTLILREFTPVLNSNNIVFNFKPGFRMFGNQTPSVDLNKINEYLGYLTQGDKTYVFEYADGIYEFLNPCSGWSFVFLESE